MLVGRPFRPGWPAELRAPELPLDVRPVLQQLMAPRPGEAFDSMATVAAVLRDVALMVAARTAAPATEPSPAAESGGRPGRAVLVGLVLLLVLATLASVFFRGMS